MKLIAITGTHGTGKTTMSFQLAAEYKAKGANVKVIQEVARSCPFPLNQHMTSETAKWIYHEHRRKELEAARTHEIVICDRTCFDSFVYAECLGLLGLYWEQRAAKRQLQDYDQLLFVVPADTLPIDDGIRSMDLQFQLDVHERLHEQLRGLPNLHYINQNQIFNKENTWTSYLL